jgi:O-antigen/teichoic acid export membrane protein
MQQLKELTARPGGDISLPLHQRIRESRLVRQNLVLLAGGLISGFGGFVYHAIAGQVLGPQKYGEIATLVALYTMGTTINLILILVLARYAASLLAGNKAGALRWIVSHTSFLVAGPALLFVVAAAALSPLVAEFERLRSPIPVIWLALAVAGCWYMAIPRGMLQGIQSFMSLSLNLSLELVIRTASLALLIWAGLEVSGSMVAILMGVIFAYLFGMWSLRDIFGLGVIKVQMRKMLGFALTAAAGTLGVLLLYNMDVVLAGHFLPKNDVGIYGGLNKIGTIVFFGTLSVSQVLFPRVVEAVATGRRHPGLLLLLSAGLITLLGLGAIGIFALAPGLVVGKLFGPQFRAAQDYLIPIGFFGLGLSLNNLLVQFYMAVNDRFFIPVVAGGCALEATLVTLFHASVGQVVTDVVVAMWTLLAALIIRSLFLIPRLRPEMVDSAKNPVALSGDGV